MVILFQPTGISYFNSMFDRTILNVVFSGLLAFLILLEIENVADVLMYRAHNINKRSIDQYILFSRVSSLRGILQTLSGLEYSSKEIRTEPMHHRKRWRARLHCALDDGADNLEADRSSEKKESDDERAQGTTIVSTLVDTERSLSVTDLEESQPSAGPTELRRIGIPVRDGVPRPHVRLLGMVVPLLFRLTLLTLELLTIYFSSNISEEVKAGRSFNVRLKEGNAVIKTSQADNSPCREFIHPAKGVEHNGSVLLCIGSEHTHEFPTENDTFLYFSFDPSQNQMEYVVGDLYGKEISVYVRMFINLIGDEGVELGPLRPDLPVDDNHSKKVIQRVMNRAISRLGFGMKIEQIEEIVDDRNVIQYKYPRTFGNTSKLAIERELLSELHTLSLDLNITKEGEEDALYVFKKDRGYFRHENPVIAIVGKNRLAQGWLVIAWVTLLIVRFVAQRFLISFDELAYLALKTVHGADISVGPLANVQKKERLSIGKFSDGRVGHIGFRAANCNQDRVENFYGCAAVWGSGECLRTRERLVQRR